MELHEFIVFIHQCKAIILEHVDVIIDHLSVGPIFQDLIAVQLTGLIVIRGCTVCPVVKIGHNIVRQCERLGKINGLGKRYRAGRILGTLIALVLVSVPVLVPVFSAF